MRLFDTAVLINKRNCGFQCDWQLECCLAIMVIKLITLICILVAVKSCLIPLPSETFSYICTSIWAECLFGFVWVCASKCAFLILNKLKCKFSIKSSTTEKKENGEEYPYQNATKLSFPYSQNSREYKRFGEEPLPCAYFSESWKHTFYIRRFFSFV